jgi:DNA-binding CsgD family transcriptional regulator
MTLPDIFNNSEFIELLESSPGVMGVFNYDTFQYKYISKNVKNIFGYDIEEYLDGGLNFKYSTLNKVHADIIATNIFPVYMEYCVKHASDEGVKRLRFSYEYKVNCKSGNSIWCLHQFTIIKVDNSGYPILDLFYISDISETKKDDLINFTIAQKNNNDVYETIYTVSHQTRDLSLLSGREMQIVKLLCEGNSTPKIANKLHLSEHTVKTHRKNILQKMEVKNTMDIVKIAYEKGLF